MASRVTVWLGAAVVVWLVGACGKSEGSAEAIPRAELPGRVASLMCESIGSCCQSSGYPIDVAVCKRLLTADLQEELLEEQEEGVVYDAQAAGDCLAVVAPQLVCGDIEGGDGEACERVFRGTVALGQPCSSSRQCARAAGQEVSCQSDDGLSPQVCTELESARRGKAGDLCTGTCYEGDECLSFGAPVPAPGPGGVPVPQPEPAMCYRDDGLYCGGTNLTCLPLLQVGFACDDYAACVGDAFCDFQTQVCTAPRPNGEPCQSSDECQSGACARANDLEPNGVCGASQTVTAEQCESVVTDEPPPDDSAPLPPDAPAPGAP